MTSDLFEIESNELFSKSKLWQYNQDFYQHKGITAFSKNLVPYHLTSNSFVGKTYAELIFGYLNDLAEKGNITDTAYILEMGAGHGRLAYYVLYNLDKLIQNTKRTLPPYCYILSDIVESSLDYFLAHPQLKIYYDKGVLDVSYFEAISSERLYLRKAEKTIAVQSLAQPIVAIANYFFDSIPNDLFYIKDQDIACSTVSIKSKENPEGLNPEELIQSLEVTFDNTPMVAPFYKEPIINDILESYKGLLKSSYLYFPAPAMRCIENLSQLSKEGLLLLSIDKGFHELHDLDNIKKPDIVTHGSFSIWVNFHALAAYCKQKEGLALLPSSSNFHLELGTLLFLKDSKEYIHTINAYEKYVNGFGPDDFNSIKHLAYNKVSKLTTKELIVLFRLSAYDSTFFIKLLPRLKQVSKTVSFNERKRLSETLQKVWDGYFSIGENYDLPYEIAGLYYDLGFYKEALTFFNYSEKLHGEKADTFYNVALSYYQLKKDNLFYATLGKGRIAFPEYKRFAELDKLEMAD